MLNSRRFRDESWIELGMLLTMLSDTIVTLNYGSSNSTHPSAWLVYTVPLSLPGRLLHRKRMLQHHCESLRNENMMFILQCFKEISFIHAHIPAFKTTKLGVQKIWPGSLICQLLRLHHNSCSSFH